MYKLVKYFHILTLPYYNLNLLLNLFYGLVMMLTDQTKINKFVVYTCSWNRGKKINGFRSQASIIITDVGFEALIPNSSVKVSRCLSTFEGVTGQFGVRGFE